MEFMKKIKHELNYLKKEDFVQLGKFIVSIIPAVFFKVFLLIKKRDIWLICEAANEARDNGYCFFRYLSKNHLDKDCYYAIHKAAPDYEKVVKLGKTVEYGSVQHWILYLCSKYNISTQKSGRPGVAIGYVLEQLHLLRSKTIFLQHGITINKATWLFYKNTYMRLFICGAKPEYEYVRQYFGYPDNNLAYIGFCRFDDYYDFKVNKKHILLMPSWREWIGSKNEYSSVFEDTREFTNTEYYQKYQALISNKEFIRFLEENDIVVFFYPHRDMQPFISSFHSGSKNIIIANSDHYDIRDLLITSALMITDYSSASLDFIYMKKPVIYYQFDLDRFRQAQYEKGYFDYEKSGLGVVTLTEKETIEQVIESYKNGFMVSDVFLKAHKEFFTIYDNHNCYRTYRTIKGLKK